MLAGTAPYGAELKGKLFMIQVQLNGKHLTIPEDDDAWKDEPWDDAQEFHQTLREFTPPHNQTTAK